MSNSAVEVLKVSHSFGGRKALNELAFAVAPREIFGLLGPNGGGKSTLFRILSTLMEPDDGTVEIFDFDVRTQASNVRQQIGVVFQSPSLDKRLTVMENLVCQGHLYGLKGMTLRSRIDELLEQFTLTDRAKDIVDTLSGGLSRRVEIAKGMIHKPRLLLLDEPSTGLDPAARRDMWQNLVNVRDNDDVTVMLTTHIMEEADTCDRVAILNQGELVAIGSPYDLKQEIAGSMIKIESEDLVALSVAIEQEFDVTAKIMFEQIRIERSDAVEFVSHLMDKFADDVRSVTIGQPSLEDVFMEKTGSSFF